MLTIEDRGTIDNAIWKRLNEPGKTEIADVKIEHVIATTKEPEHIRVGIWCVLKDRIGFEGLIDTRSFFDLPAEFTHRHLLNEIDEVSEQIKEARRNTQASRLVMTAGAVQNRHQTKGTGLRGRWGSSNSRASARQ
jgi:hypothetical protein